MSDYDRYIETRDKSLRDIAQRDARIKSPAIDAQVKAALGHTRAADIYLPNHIDQFHPNGVAPKRTITDSPVSQVLRSIEAAKRLRDEHKFWPRLRPVTTFSGMTEWQADYHSKHARNLTPADAYDSLAKYMGLSLRSRPASYGIQRTQKRSIAPLPRVVVCFPTGAARWKAELDGKKSYGPTPTAALRALMAQIEVKSKNAGSC
jgi:hypothetical protein